MARTFRQRRPMHAVSELNITNLVDLAFVLLIIFMIATPMLQQEQTIPINLPKESQSQRTPPDDKTIFETITIQADGTYALGMRALSRAQLTTEFSRFAAQTKLPVIRIRMDAKSTAQQFATLMEELEKAGLSKISIDTQVATAPATR